MQPDVVEGIGVIVDVIERAMLDNLLLDWLHHPGTAVATQLLRGFGIGLYLGTPLRELHQPDLVART